MNTIRSRWAAIGAAVAVTLGAGGIGLVSATSPSDAVAYVPITPCRLADTRPAPNTVGPKSSPVGGDETLVIQATGDNGDCTGIPTSATGLQLNVTAVGATLPTFLTIWGAGAQPDASALNPGPGQPPAPNAVTSGLTGAGAINVYNFQGFVNVIVDVVGYYTDHNHDDRYYTEAEVDTALAGKADVGDADNVQATWGLDQSDSLATDGTDKIVASITLDTPGIGYAKVDASLNAFGFAASPLIRCSIVTDGVHDDGNQFIQSVGANQWANMSGTRGFTYGFFTIGGETTFNLVCDANAANLLTDANLTAVFVPDPDAQFVIVFP